MRYWIVCQGRLLAGAKEKECMARIQRITKLSEENIKKNLLNGRPMKMFSSDYKIRVRKYSLAFRNAGLDISIQSEEMLTSGVIQADYR